MTPRGRAMLAEEAIRADLPLARVVGPDRTRAVVNVRWRAIARLKADGETHAQIAQALDLDRSTVINALKRGQAYG